MSKIVKDKTQWMIAERVGEEFPEPNGKPMPPWKIVRACNRGEFRTARKVGKRWYVHASEVFPNLEVRDAS